MNAVRSKAVVDPIVLRGSLDQRGEQVQEIKRHLFLGSTLVFTTVDLGGPLGAFVIYMVVPRGSDEVIRSLAETREAHKAFVSETRGEMIVTLGSQAPSARRIADAIMMGCDVHLVPETEDRRVGGNYTLHVLDLPRT
jgi:hypothetical protein